MDIQRSIYPRRRKALLSTQPLEPVFITTGLLHCHRLSIPSHAVLLSSGVVLSPPRRLPASASLPRAHVHVIFTFITVSATRAMADPQVPRHQMYALMVLHQISAIGPSMRRGERRARRPNILRPGQPKEMII